MFVVLASHDDTLPFWECVAIGTFATAEEAQEFCDRHEDAPAFEDFGCMFVERLHDPSDKMPWEAELDRRLKHGDGEGV